MSFTSVIGENTYVGQEYTLSIITGIDLTTHTGNVEVRITKPDGTTSDEDATIVVAGTGAISLAFAAGELTPAGVWLFQPALKTEDAPGPTFALSVLAAFDNTPIPTPQEIRDFLEGYCITQTRLSDSWVARRRDAVIKWIERTIGQTITTTTTYTEYLSGTGSPLLVLSRRPVVSLDTIEYVIAPPDFDASLNIGSIELVAEEGILRARFDLETRINPRMTFVKGKYNIKVTYTAGTAQPDDEMREAILALTSEKMLAHLASTTGGGGISVSGYQRNYGPKGKYSQARKELAKWGLSNLAGKMTGVTGS